MPTVRPASEAAPGRFVAPHLLPGEVATATGAAWAAPVRGRVLVLFTGRRRYRIVVTDRRLLVLPRARVRAERRQPAYVRPLAELAVLRVHPARVLLQLLVGDQQGNRVVLEFRPWERPLAQTVVDAIRAAAPE